MKRIRKLTLETLIIFRVKIKSVQNFGNFAWILWFTKLSVNQCVIFVCYFAEVEKLTKVYHIMGQKTALYHAKANDLPCKTIAIALQKAIFRFPFRIEKVVKLTFFTLPINKKRHLMLYFADYDK
ncbi:hypothetical protein E5358_12495 [Palleniella muris]|uniref:Uncharacterized protein n=1 Tax=Palleniella muris TaxID=3038145 RepID=A0AC61QMN8_9BACT|nr:hypothetical protein [Palleniella muris]TGX80584.1 hypothetical protein E5358_12495 [Palleniella muris]